MLLGFCFGHGLPVLLLIRINSSETSVFNVSLSVTLEINKEKTGITYSLQNTNVVWKYWVVKG